MFIYSEISKAYKVYNFKTIVVEKIIYISLHDHKLEKKLSKLNYIFS